MVPLDLSFQGNSVPKKGTVKYEKYNISAQLHNCTTAQLHNCNKITSYYALIVTVVALLFAANLQAQQYPAE